MSIFNPFEPAVGYSFYNREKQIDDILKFDSHFILIGIRGIGKTSLLYEIKRRIDEEKIVIGIKTFACYISLEGINTIKEFQSEFVKRINKDKSF